MGCHRLQVTTATRACLLERQPDADRSQNGSAAVCQCEFGVAGCQGPPLFEGVEVPFDDVAAFVLFVEAWQSAAGGATSLSVSDLV